MRSDEFLREQSEQDVQVARLIKGLERHQIIGVAAISVLGLLLVMEALGQYVPTLSNPLVLVAAALIALGVLRLR